MPEGEKNGKKKMTKELLLLLVPKEGGCMEPPIRNPLSHWNFAMKFTPYMNAL